MTQSILNNTEEIIFCTKSIAAVMKYQLLLKSFTLAGEAATPVSLTAAFQADIDATSALDAAEASVAKLRMTQRLARAASRQLHVELKRYLVAVSGPEIVQIAQDFGYPPGKARKQTVASKSKQVALAKATRVARGTRGKKQKAAIKGVAAAPAIEPTAPAAAPVAAPATK